ncbi:MAG: glycosyl hydrolase family 18 protein [Eubacteriales bacterium]|nr:glycosyl hydrolase family 18 protein [Eubacteriales bacterium]
MEIYVVKPGDTVYSIAEFYGVDTGIIIYDNQLIQPYDLVTGQALLINNGWDYADVGIRTNGYAYPFISNWVLENTLPFLSGLSVFSYGFTEDGELISPMLNEDRMIKMSVSFGTLPILTLTPLDKNGVFNNNLISAIVRNPNKTETLINNLLDVMAYKNYGGLDIDFEYIKAEDRDLFTEFVRKCANSMHENGYLISVALAPKTSANQQGLLYEGKDYKALGEIADSVLLMTYEWGYTYGPPMAVAPINQVRRVVEYAVTEINPLKIDLGIPNYGYDWPLPYERGITKAKTIGNIEAVRIAADNGVNIEFDETAQSPYFTYESNGVSHDVWFEDVRSIQKKFDLITEFGLHGAGYWNIMQFFRANWLLLENNFYIKSIR